MPQWVGRRRLFVIYAEARPGMNRKIRSANDYKPKNGRTWRPISPDVLQGLLEEIMYDGRTLHVVDLGTYWKLELEPSTRLAYHPSASFQAFEKVGLPNTGISQIRGTGVPLLGSL